MLKKHTHLACLVVTACTAAAISSTGCRSMPGRNMFGFRSEPSAEALAGSGPTTTYPVPPSSLATPEAIASIAGGTAAPSRSPLARPAATRSPSTAQVAGFEITPGYATPASSVAANNRANMAAAQANGISSGSPTASAGYQSPAAPQSQPSGYTFGSKALNPKASAGTPATSYAGGSSFTPPSSGFTTPSTSFTPPPATSYTKPPAAKSSSGFTLPTDSPALAAITPPTTSASNATAPPPPPTEVSPPAAAAPEFSTASRAGSLSAPGSSTAQGSTSQGTYTPGSTATSSGYPVGDFPPTTTGSFYR